MTSSASALSSALSSTKATRRLRPPDARGGGCSRPSVLNRTLLPCSAGTRGTRWSIAPRPAQGHRPFGLTAVGRPALDRLPSNLAVPPRRAGRCGRRRPPLVPGPSRATPSSSVATSCRRSDACSAKAPTGRGASHAESAQRRGIEAQTLRIIHAVLRRALNQAVRWGSLPRNVAALVDVPRQVRYEARAIAPEQARAVDALRDDRLEALVTLTLATGYARAKRWPCGGATWTSTVER